MLLIRIIKYLIVSNLIFFSAFAAAGQILVSGAASLTDAFNQLASEYQQINPETKVLTSFASSDTVLQQIINGAPVNVFASADQITMDKAQQNDLLLADSRINFIANKLVLIVPKDNQSLIINSLEDLVNLSKENNDLKIAIANPDSVPAGRYTKQSLENSGLWQSLSAHQITGQNVRQVLSYVQRGEVDAGFVFASDAFIAGDKVKIIADIATVEPILYPIAQIKSADENNKMAQGFINFVLSPKGQTILNKYGFTSID